jgi:hypothetical protein
LLRAVEARKSELLTSSSTNSLTASGAKQLAFLRNRGATFLLTGAVASCLEAILGNPILDPFRLSFGDRVNPQMAEGYWAPIVNACVPFVHALTQAVEGGLKSAEAATNAMRDFRSFVESTQEANTTIYAPFASLIRVS